MECTVDALGLLAACNRLSSCAAVSLGAHSWLSLGADAAPASGLLAFGSGHSVALYDVAGARVLALLAGHTGRVNGVCWVAKPSAARCAYADEDELLSCGSDGELRAWRLARRGARAGLPAALNWECTATLRAHSGSVTAVACHVARDGALLVATTGSDLALRAWFRPATRGASFCALGTVISRAASLLEAVAVSCLPLPPAPPAPAQDGGGDGEQDADADCCSRYGFLLAAGGADCRIHLYTLRQSGLVHALSLSGPMDWVRSIAFSHNASLIEHFSASAASSSIADPGGAEQQHQHQQHLQQQQHETFLAAASQDRKLRIWRLRCTSFAITAAATPSYDAATAMSDSPSPVSASGLGLDLVLPGDGGDDDDDAEGAVSSAAASSAAALLALQRPRIFSAELRGRPCGAVTRAAFSVALDAMLAGGHDSWVSSVAWHPPVAVRVDTPRAAAGGLLAASSSLAAGAVCESSTGGTCAAAPVPQAMLQQPPCLVSASMDKTIALWQPESAAADDERARAEGAGGGSSVAADASVAELGGAPAAALAASPSVTSAAAAAAVPADYARAWAGVWRPAVRVGAAGGAIAGFFGALLTPCAGLLLAHSFSGALHSWALAPPPRALAALASFSARAAARALEPRPCAQGHAGGVTDLAWAPSTGGAGCGGGGGAYLASASLDSTVRVWLPVPAAGGHADTWLEASRPQIHGYEMLALLLPPSGRGCRGLPPHRLVSAGDEKVLRVFDAPRLFLAALAALPASAEVRARAAAALRQPSQPPSGNAGAAGAPLALRRADSAYSPELSLTNRAVYAETSAALTLDRYQADGRDAVGVGAAPLRPSSLAGGGDAEGVGEERAAASSAAAAAAALAGALSAADDGPPPAVVSSASARVVRGWLALPLREAPVLSLSEGVHPPPPLPLLLPAAPPLDEDLVQHARWAESDKLFGHAREVVALALSAGVEPDSLVIASAAKARDAAGARIRLWCPRSGRELQLLPEAHSATVTALAFSRAPTAVAPSSLCRSRCCHAAALVSADGGDDDGAGTAAAPCGAASGARAFEYLVSASKDRSVAVWGREIGDGSASDEERAAASGAASSRADGGSSVPPPPRAFAPFRLLTFVRDAHKRVIWSVDCAPMAPREEGEEAAPGGGGALFATGSRDAIVKLWRVGGGCGGEAASNQPFAAQGAALPPAPTAALRLVASLPAAPSAVTAVAFAPLAMLRRSSASASGAGAVPPLQLRQLLAVGEESGAVALWSLRSDIALAGPGVGSGGTSLGVTASPLARVGALEQHVRTVRRIAWQPWQPLAAPLAAAEGSPESAALAAESAAGALELRFASASEDESLRIFRVVVALARHEGE